MRVLRTELIPSVLDAAGHMALDEAVLRHSSINETVLRFYRWSGPGCTFGYSQKHSDVLAACRCRGLREVLPVRRATGGGIVFHDGDITFSLVFGWDRLRAPREVYRRIHGGICAALKASGLPVRLWSPAAPPAGIAESCFVRAEPLDLVDADGRKILGGALRKKALKGLYQGSLRPESLGRNSAALRACIEDGLAREFGSSLTTQLRPAWLAAGRGLQALYRSPGWNERRER